MITDPLLHTVLWPKPSSDFILIGDGDFLLFNPRIDQAPAECRPQTYLAMAVKEGTLIGIIQLANRHNGFRFTEQDQKHLGLICDHMA
jgi:GAF domain-containing protein